MRSCFKTSVLLQINFDDSEITEDLKINGKALVKTKTKWPF